MDGTHFKWLWGDGVDMPRKLWFRSSLAEASHRVTDEKLVSTRELMAVGTM